MNRSLPLREDALRNRGRIVEAAGVAYLTCADQLSLSEIAARAGVSRATIYRHFPRRELLASAVAEQQFELLRQVVDRGECTLREVLDLVLWTQVSMGPLTSLLHELPVAEQQRLTRRLVETVTPVLVRSRAAGEIRADAEPADLELILRTLKAWTDALPDDHDRETTTRRLVTLLLDGLSNPTAAPS